MGLELAKLVTKKKVTFRSLLGNAITIDAYNAIYQFLALIRVRYGVPLKDRYGRVTSHLNGLLFRTTKLLEYDIKPVYVFDGRPPTPKMRVLEEREVKKREAEREWRDAVKKKDHRKAWAKAVQTSRLRGSMVDDSKALLDHMGIPWVQAPSEGEAQAAYMTQVGDAWASSSQDYDSLPFGAVRLVRNLTITGKKYYRKRPGYYRLEPELIVLSDILEKLGLTRSQLVDLCILMGTDYNEGIKGVGPVRAHQLIKRHGSAERALEKEHLDLEVDLGGIRSIFLDPAVTEDYHLEWRRPDADELMTFLCEERDFSPKRVRSAVERLQKATREVKQSTLDV